MPSKVSLRGLSTPRKPRISAGVSPSGCSRSSATMRQRKPRHQFVYTRADSTRLYRSDISPEISTQRFTRVQSVFCFRTAYVLVERLFLRHSRLHSAYLDRKP